MKPEYAIEAAALGLFMIAASVAAVTVDHPDSPIRAAIPDPIVRRLLIGMAMGLTAMALIYSPMGRRSGAHMNPAVTLTFWRLGRVDGRHAVRYGVAQFFGAVAGLTIAFALLQGRLADLHFIATRPGPTGLVAAFAAETGISFLLMLVVLVASSSPTLSRWTGAIVGVLIALYITLEEPLSGMSMNPARTFGPALLAGQFDALWIYFLAPPLGMLLAAEWFRRGSRPAPCPRLNHTSGVPCIFCGELCTTT